MLIYCTFMDECRLNICARPASPCLSLAEVGFITEGPQEGGATKNALCMTVPSFVAKYQPIRAASGELSVTTFQQL